VFPLPAFISVNGSWEEILARLYAHFEDCFKCNPRRNVRGKPLVFDARKLDSDLEEGFWHVVSRGRGDDRQLDPERARRICWLKPLLGGELEGISRWATIEGDGTIKLYYWIEAEDFVLILAEKPKVVALVTAFFIDKPWLRADLEKRRNEGTAF
jgi:hypothetical protein